MSRETKESIGIGGLILLTILAVLFWPRKSTGTGTDGSTGGGSSGGGSTGGSTGGTPTGGSSGGTITVTIGQIGSGVVPGSFTVAAGTPMQIEAFPVSGWHFSEWRIDGVKYTTSTLLNYTPTRSVTLTAVFEIDAEEVPQETAGVISLGIINAPGDGVPFAEYRYWAAVIGRYWSPTAGPSDGNIAKRWTFDIPGASITGHFDIVIWDIHSNELHREHREEITLPAGNWNYNCATRQIERA